MSSTRSIGDAIDSAASHDDEKDALIVSENQARCCACTSCGTKALVWTQFAYEIIDTLGRTGYTSATLITDLAGLEENFLGMNYYALGASIPLAMVFAYAEARSHCSQSEHFNNAHADAAERALEEGNVPPVINPQNVKLTWSQSIFSSLHFVSDIYEGMQMPVMISKLAGIDKTHFAVQAASYAGFATYSLFGNLQEYLNTRVAFKEENAAKLSRGPSNV